MWKKCELTGNNTMPTAQNGDQPIQRRAKEKGRKRKKERKKITKKSK